MSDTPGSGRREAEELQREAEAIRADMNRTLSALERKLSPQQLLDRSLEFVQANGGDVLQKIGATVSKNPLPLLLTSAGLIWLVSARRRSSTRHRFDSPSMSTRTGDFDRSSQSFSSSMEGRASGLKRRAHRTVDATRERAGRTWDATRERTQEFGSNLNDLISEQPLVCGAIAVAIGAVIGAAFPPTAYERDLVARAQAAGGEMLDEYQASKQQREAEKREPTSTPQTPPTAH